MKPTETSVEIKTSDGVCDAAFVYPPDNSGAGVLLWPDAGGLRESMREMSVRLAENGYSVLVPNLFYRVRKEPVLDLSHFSFTNAEDRAKLVPLMDSVKTPGAAERDAEAYLAFLDAQPQVDTNKKIGTHGYCLGGPLALKTAAVAPGRVGACASFHGGGLVTNTPDSPHLLAPKVHARLYFGIAANDDQKQPDAKNQLREAFPQAEIEVYPATHGWCVPDMPAENGHPIYDEEQAERAWAKLLALYRANLV